MIFGTIPSLPNRSAGFRELDQVRRQMERLFDTVNDPSVARSAGVFPAINVTEDDDALYVRAELPGLSSDDLEVTVENDTLTVAGERSIPDDNGSASYHRREREWGAFRRSLTLPVRVDGDRVEARHSDGVLTITLPKAAEARPRQITVQASA